MSDTTNPLPSITVPVIDRFRRWNPIWYKWIKPLLETVKATADELVQVEEITDQLAGTWGIQVNVDHRVTAAIRLNGTDATSSFAVLADRFIVVHPSQDGTTIQAFVVGSVDGSTTVGINGSLVVDQSILARHISVNDLSAITANIGDITAGVLRSPDNDFIIDLDNKEIMITT